MKDSIYVAEMMIVVDTAAEGRIIRAGCFT